MDLISGEHLRILCHSSLSRKVGQIESAIFTTDLGNRFMNCDKVHANHAILDLLALAYWRCKANCQIVEQNKRLEWGESGGTNTP